MAKASLGEVHLSVELSIVFHVQFGCELLEEVVLNEALSFRDQLSNGEVGVLEIEVEAV